jgi:peptidylprolyl isomerase
MKVFLACLALILATPALADDFRPVDPENLLVLDTSQGRVLVELRPDIAPLTVAHIKTLVRKGWYDGDQFYRVYLASFAQTGAKKYGGPYDSGLGTVKGEFSFQPASPVKPVAGGAGFSGSMAVVPDASGRAWPKFCRGVTALAHYADPDSGDAQVFFIVSQMHALDRTFAAWGRVLAGQSAINLMHAGEPPPAPDTLAKAQIAADMPEAARPKVFAAAPGTPAFDAAIAKAKADKGAAFDACDVEVPVQVN